ncbi:MAG: peptide-methionine (S)-S-oxide reductase MsrA [Flavobacterium sp.]
MIHSIATFAGGCFWCTEAIFLQLKGVESVSSGYIGGFQENPTYNQICSGTTGHAEAVQILYNSDEITFETLLEVFFATHNPTTLNRQGADVGTQYRSEIFYHTDKQKLLSLAYIQQVSDAKFFDSDIVTKLSPASVFYKAEQYHQNYYQRNKEQSYCNYVITPKMIKLTEAFTPLLK